MSRPHSASRRRPTVGGALIDVKARYFVGREKECRLFADCLAGTTGEWLLLNVYGPGGVGKSTLLDAFRRIAEGVGALYLYLDAWGLPPTPEAVVQQLVRALARAGASAPSSLDGCLDAIHEAAVGQPVVLSLDTYEQVGELDRWLREALLAHLPQRAVVVIAGRHPLAGLWRDYPAWRQLVRPLPLEPFTLDETREYLTLYGVIDERLIRAAWDFTRGHPLALSLQAALVVQEGPAALAKAPERPEVVSELAQRWLREVPNDAVRTLVEAAATVRRFDRDLLSQLTGGPVARADFLRFLALSFVRGGPSGWALHDLLRTAVSHELQWCSPLALRTMRQRALAYYARLAVMPSLEEERAAALEEFFYLLGDELVRAALFAAEAAEDADGESLRVVPATPADLPALHAYMEDWRRNVAREGSTHIELVDRKTRTTFHHVVSAEHNRRETEIIDLPGLVALGPGVVRVLKDWDGRVRGICVAIPVNARTLGYLEAQPVTGPYFRSLGPEERAEYAVPPERTDTWFIRLIDLRDPTDLAGRAALLRDLFRLASRGGRMVTSTPLPFYQDLLRRLGFAEIEGVTHYDFGPGSPSATFILDLRGPRMAHYLARMAGSGVEATSEGGRRAASGQEGLLGGLTPREREVALAVMDGLSNAEIARRFGIAEVTVKKHLSNVFAKAGVQSRTQLIKRILEASR